MEGITLRENRELRILKNYRLIREELKLDDFHWQWMASLTWPKLPRRNLAELRKDVNIFCERIRKEHRIRLSAAGLIVERAGHAPHAHILLTTIKTTPGTFDLSTLDPKAVYDRFWPFKHGVITTDKERSQNSFIKYIISDTNMNLDSTKDEYFDVFYFKRNALFKSKEATYGTPATTDLPRKDCTSQETCKRTEISSITPLVDFWNSNVELIRRFSRKTRFIPEL